MPIPTVFSSPPIDAQYAHEAPTGATPQLFDLGSLRRVLSAPEAVHERGQSIAPFSRRSEGSAAQLALSPPSLGPRAGGAWLEPPETRCPISLNSLVDAGDAAGVPVVLVHPGTGRSYCKEPLHRWLMERDTDPMSRCAVTAGDFGIHVNLTSPLGWPQGGALVGIRRGLHATASAPPGTVHCVRPPL